MALAAIGSLLPPLRGFGPRTDIVFARYDPPMLPRLIDCAAREAGVLSYRHG